MFVLAVFRWEGDPDTLLAAYDRELQHAVPRATPSNSPHLRPRRERNGDRGPLGDRGGPPEHAGEPGVPSNLEAAGFPSDPTEAIYQVHATIP